MIPNWKQANCFGLRQKILITLHSHHQLKNGSGGFLN